MFANYPAAMKFAKWLACFLLLLLAALIHLSSSASVEEVNPQVRSSMEAFLKAHTHLRMDGEAPVKAKKAGNSTGSEAALSSHLKLKKKANRALELAEEALRLIYHELYEGVNGTDALEKQRSVRQSFLAGGLSGASEYVMSLVENSLEDLPSLPRLEAQECVKRSVCEAHNQPKKYGLIGLVLQLLFPPYTKNEDPTNTISKYQLAARYGRQSNANCGIQYDGCMLNLLDIVQALVNAFIR
ncbi:hypothetical protein JTE90_006068 [Oedothorax gibbosus]|uniref:Uncharacterized protein n=1 Tax=Oedothorax gibbosus TaxID=931172 RepID=A0AAV6V5G8_9ARAC|nr:hypothetical protein JTE90_006068 [Oedothorax gibbosus]